MSFCDFELYIGIDFIISVISGYGPAALPFDIFVKILMKSSLLHIFGLILLTFSLFSYSFFKICFCGYKELSICTVCSVFNTTIVLLLILAMVGLNKSLSAAFGYHQRSV